MHDTTTDSESETTSDAREKLRIGTASELLKLLQEEGIIGMWKDRDDLEDSVEFARTLRERTWRRESD